MQPKGAARTHAVILDLESHKRAIAEPDAQRGEVNDPAVLASVDLEGAGDNGYSSTVQGGVKVTEGCRIAAEREEGVDCGDRRVEVIYPDWRSAPSKKLELTWSLAEGERLTCPDVGEAAAELGLGGQVEPPRCLERVSDGSRTCVLTG